MNKKGFTLIEILVVIAIIAVLTTVVVASLDSARTKNKTAQALTDLAQVKLAITNYYSTRGRYPIAGTSVSNPASAGDCFSGSTTDWIPGLTPRYIAALPQSPFYRDSSTCADDSGYGYYSDVDGRGYALLLVSTHCEDIVSRFPEMSFVDGSDKKLGMCGYWTSDILPPQEVPVKKKK